MKQSYYRRITTFGLMICLVCALGILGGCSQQEKTDSGATDQTTERTITDDANRTVTIPSAASLERIYYSGAIGEIYCFTLAPELAGGTTMEFTEAELKYLPEGTADLEYLGTLSGGKELNPEAIMSADIQVIFSVTQSAPEEADISQADDLQAQTNIPVVVLDGSFTKTTDTYRTLGELLGKEAEAEKLAAYCETTLAAVEEAVATVPADERVSLYYAEGPNGLQTEPESSTHALAFKIAGAKNVAAVDATPGKGMSDVSLEQVLAWNPEVIVAWDKEVRGGADELIRTDANWSTIKAVQDDKVYTMPNIPFSWCDRPPAVNRFLGVQWIANTLYPEAYDVDMVEVTKEFYEMFYHRNISTEEAKELLGNSYTS